MAFRFVHHEGFLAGSPSMRATPKSCPSTQIRPRNRNLFLIRGVTSGCRSPDHLSAHRLQGGIRSFLAPSPSAGVVPPAWPLPLLREVASRLAPARVLSRSPIRCRISFRQAAGRSSPPPAWRSYSTIRDIRDYKHGSHGNSPGPERVAGSFPPFFARPDLP